MGSFYRVLLLSVFFSAAATAAADDDKSVIRMLPSGVSYDYVNLYCDSWRLTVEANNIGSWEAIPSSCLSFVDGYMNGAHYAFDSEAVARDSMAFAETVKIAGDGKDVWVFDVDDTLISNLPFFAAHGFGSEEITEAAFNEWINSLKAPALPASLRLYKYLRGVGFHLVLLTARREAQREVTEKNLLLAGYHSWGRLILRGASDIGKDSVVFKSEKRAELVAQGYRIHGSSGDQWSDLLGSPLAPRSFKLPNPMYFNP